MALWERLVTPDPVLNPRLEVHAWMAAITEFARGAPGVDRAAIIAAFGLRAEDEPDFDVLIAAAAALGADRQFEFGRLVHDVLLLGIAGIAYDTRTAYETRISNFT